MTTMPPLANLFALFDPEPASHAGVVERMSMAGCGELSSPRKNWTVGTWPLPSSVPDSASLRQSGFFFAEGRQEIAGDLSKQPEERFLRLKRLVDEGAERLSEIEGDWGFLRFRPDGTVVTVRSCSGRVPFYWWIKPPRMAISTRFTDFVRFLPEAWELDHFVHAVWTGRDCMFPQGRTFLRDIQAVPPGGFWEFDSGSRVSRSGTYWPRPVDPPPTPKTCPTPENVAALRAALIGVVERELDPQGGNLLTLSGGFDSSVLATIAGRILGRKLSAWSLLPERQDLYETEKRYVDSIAKHCGIKRLWEARVVPEEHPNALRKAPSVVFQVLHPALCDLPRVLQQQPVSVLLGGEAADDVCGSFGTMVDWAKVSGPLPFISAWLRGQAKWRDPVRWLKYRSLNALGRPMLPVPGELPDLIHPDLRAEYSAWQRQIRSEMSQDTAFWPYLRRRLLFDEFRAMNWEVCSQLGIRRMIPFLDRRVMEVALSCHPSELILPGYKKILKHAFAADLPALNADRPHKDGYWARSNRVVLREWNEPLAPELAPILDSSWYPRPREHLFAWQMGVLARLSAFADNLNKNRIRP